eukprot:6191486-Pleurochrysis_carterae.AAC.1
MRQACGARVCACSACSVCRGAELAALWARAGRRPRSPCHLLPSHALLFLSLRSFTIKTPTPPAIPAGRRLGFAPPSVRMLAPLGLNGIRCLGCAFTED